LSIHLAGVLGLVLIFVIGTARPVNLGALALVMTYLVGTLVAGESAAAMYRGFPVDLLILLVGVTYLFGVAATNGTVDRIVEGAARLVRGRRALIPWIAFLVASLPAMAGALGSAGVAMLAPLSLRLAERYDIDRRMVGLMVVHGAAAGNFSPLNVLSAIVRQALAASGLEMSVTALFLVNLAYNLALAVVVFFIFGGLGLLRSGRYVEVPLPEALGTGEPGRNVPAPAASVGGLRVDQICTLVALTAVAVAAFRFGLNIGFVAMAAAVTLHLLFAASSKGAETRISWSVVLLVCGIVTYVSALQRYGTIEAAGSSIVGLGSPQLVALLLCAVAAVTSAFASSAGILGAMIPLAIPLIAQGQIGATELVVAIAVSATVVDATPFSTVGALVVANARPEEQPRIYRGLLVWGAVMVVTAPFVTWLLFILPRW
jgi:di/tricarboxylate transporter